MKNEWKGLLDEAFYAPEPERKRAFLKGLRPREIGMAEMLLTQVRYIGLSVWIVAGLILVLAILGSAMHADRTEEWIPVIIPFLAGVSVLETRKSGRCRMTELEMVTRFSLRSVLFARMTILGILCLLLLCVSAPIVAAAFGGRTVITAMHILIPYLVTTSISLAVERSAWGRKLEYASLAVAALISVLMIWMQSYDPAMVQKYADIIENWGLLIVLFLTAVTVWEQVRTIHFAEVPA